MLSLISTSFRGFLGIALILTVTVTNSYAQGTRLLRQPSISATQIAFVYGSDLWVADLNGQKAVRLTSTPAVESDPHFSPDGKWIAFSSNRSGNRAVYIVSAQGGEATRLTWYPSSDAVRGWTPDGSQVLYASDRETAPVAYNRLWTVSVKGGPSTMIAQQWSNDGHYSPDGKQLIIDKMRRWDVEWRAYRGGQNTPLLILNLADFSETLIPNERSTDIHPIWLGDKIYFISDRNGGVANIWSYSPSDKSLQPLTKFKGSDVKWLAGQGNRLVFEQDGYLHQLDLAKNATTQLAFTVTGDFPWADTRWEDVGRRISAVALSPTGKRAIMEARGEIFTVPVENGDVRNITQSSQAADRAPLWSPLGNQIAWFSDANGKGYTLQIAAQDGLGKPKTIALGESKLAWEPVWSSDGKYIAFTDDDVRIRIVDIAAETIQTADVGGINLERGDMGLTWSPDGQWLAYAKVGENMFRSIMVWNVKTKNSQSVTNSFADAFSPAWDRDNRHLYFLASTELALGSGWANTSSQTARPEYEAWVINLRSADQSPFKPGSDEEEEKKTDTPEPPKVESKEPAKKDTAKKDTKPADDKAKDSSKMVLIDFDGIERRIMPLGMPKRNYGAIVAGPSGTAFVLEYMANRPPVLHKFSLEAKEAKEFLTGVNRLVISEDGKKMLASVMGTWKMINTGGPNGNDGKTVKTELRMQVDRSQEWKQIFEEAWRYERDYFYDPKLHGRNWNEVYQRYAPLIPFVKHRDDLNYILDQMNGELSVGHSFVSGGDYPSVDNPSVGLLGADLVADNGRWRIARIFNTESWNPGLSSPLDRPGLKVSVGDYLVGVNGKELTTADDPYKFLDGTAELQTTIHLSKKPSFADAWKEIVKPVRFEGSLRQRTWVEDNRRMVDSLSGGKLAYVWVPNTGGGGFVSFNRYYFAQQHKKGAVIDERFNGGGLLDDYMVDLMTRTLRASLTNEVPNGKPMQLPAGILGPKVLLINELSGSGGDFFPWVFRQQKVGPLIGARTWGGLVKSSTHYLMVDGGRITAPDNAVFDPINRKWIAENEGVAPDIDVRQDAKSLQAGRDPQLEKAVQELLKTLSNNPAPEIRVPEFPKPAQTKQ